MTDDRKPPVEARPGFVPDGDLDALLSQARDVAPSPLPDALFARLVAQAEAMVPAPAAAAPLGSRRGWVSALRQLVADIGGAPGLAGLSVAGVAGLWIGFVQPEAAAGVPGLIWDGAAGLSPALSSLLDETTPFDELDPLF
jgi:hypothetical protein